MDFLEQSFTVKFNYKVYFTTSLFHPENLLLADFAGSLKSGIAPKILFVVDQGVINGHPELLNSIRSYFRLHQEFILAEEMLIIPGGEEAKNNPAILERLIDAVNTYGIDRHSYLAAIGGGAVLDLAGYAAAVSHRGLKHIRIPTTVLSQNDSGVGVKNGINYRGKKNFLGTFSPPVAVFNDDRFLESLNGRNYYAGIAEAIKVALIKDADFFAWIESQGTALADRDAAQMNILIKRCAALHLTQISSGDPFETGSSRPLDFGHWAAHKTEQLSGFKILHGEAVALGIALDSTYSFLAGFLSAAQLHRILNVLALFFKLTHPLVQIRDADTPVLQGLTDFQEHLGGQLTITLLSAIGQGQDVHQIDLDLLIAASQYLENYTIPAHPITYSA